MITISQLRQFAELKGLRFEEHYPSTRLYINRDDSFCKIMSKTDDCYLFGLELKNNVWYWWKVFIYDVNSFNDHLLFSQRYNCNNGASVKSVMTGIKTEIKIEDFLNSHKNQ